MPLFQPAPKTEEELEASRPLEIEPGVVANMDEDEWYAKAYRGDSVPQLTVRAVLMGAVLGFLLAFTNLYIGLKTGWHLGVAITACLLSFTIWRGLVAAGIAKTQMTILENNCMQSTASAAGYSTGGTFVSAIAALFMMSATPETPDGAHLPTSVLILWTFFLAVLGVTLAIPMKRNMINQEKLKFPSGLAAASTLQSLYADAADAARKAKALLYSAVFGALWPLLIDLKVKTALDENGNPKVDAAGVLTGERGPLFNGHPKLFDWLPGHGVDRVTGAAFKPSDWTLKWDLNPVMIGAGILVGMRVSASMLAAGLILAFWLAPWGYGNAWTNPAGVEVFATSAPGKGPSEIGLWLGAPIMVAGGLMAFILQWRTIARAFSGFKKSADDSVQADAEVPGSWFAWGGGLSGAGVVLIANMYFGVPLLLGVLAVALTFVLALVACRATGESDITPTGAMGKIMQITYGVLIPQNATANLMTAGITAGAASSSADLLNDLKSGYLLGANPKRQFLAQFLGIFSGTIATVFGFKMLVPTIDSIGDGATFEAPAAKAWYAVAELFSSPAGIDGMHPAHRQMIFVGLAIGAALVILENLAPKPWKKWIPSATGLGLGFLLSFYYPLLMFVGALIGLIWERANKKTADDYLVPISAGIIAGVSIIGVIVAVINETLLK